MARSNDDAEYEWIASNLERLKRPNPDGAIVFTSHTKELSYDDLITLLETRHCFPPDISELECRGIIRDAVRESAISGVLTGRGLKGAIHKHANLFMNRPSRPYVLATSISIRHRNDLTEFTLDHAKFFFSADLPPEFSRDKIEHFLERKPANDLPEGFMTVRVQVTARAEFEAYHKALESLDLLRGIWNFWLNRGVYRRWHSGFVKPINDIRIGPVHTLHYATGEPATATFWYELLNPTELALETIERWEDLRNEETTIRRIIGASKYPDFLRTMFVRYARSLDSSDHESSFLKLWSVLEFLTVMKDGENYDDVIRRATFLSSNADYDKRVLEHLRSHRNATVHRGESSSQSETFIYQLKRYVEYMMLAHLECGSQYSSPDELVQLLSKPRDPAVLKDRITELKTELALNEAALKLHDSAAQSDDAAASTST
jgi:hypothetical protein